MGKYKEWENSKDGILALAVLCNQIVREIYQGARAYDLDPIAQKVCRKALTDKKWLSKFKRAERFALLMPLAMAENDKDLILAKELVEQELA